ncbi:phenylacetate--CoA ligase family protein, partial [archaeon]
MDFLAPITRHLIAPAWALWERSPYLRQYRRLLRTQFDPPQEIRRRQWEQIESLLGRAWQTTRFW